MSEREWHNPFLDEVDFKGRERVLTVYDMRVHLAGLVEDHPTYLGPVVCSREYYHRPAFTYDPTGTKFTASRALDEAMEFGRCGWKGGVYKFHLSSEMILTPRWGEHGVPLTMATLAAYWMGVNETLKRARK